MDFKVGSKVFYPSQGAGWIKNQKEIEFNGQKKLYFEFEFINSPISISTPLDNVNNLNIRDVESAKSIKEKITVTMIETTATNNSKFFDSILAINCIKKFDQV